MLHQSSDLTLPTQATNGVSQRTPNPSRLERTAAALALSHVIVAGTVADLRTKPLLLPNNQPPLPARLPTLARLLQNAHQQLATTVDEVVATSYAAEWLLDNFYAVEQALRDRKSVV